MYIGAIGLCESSFNAELGFIKSFNYPLSLYGSNQDCYYKIQRFRSDVCAVELIFTDFSLEPSIDCTNDYLEIDRKRYCGVDLQKKTRKEIISLSYLKFPKLVSSPLRLTDFMFVFFFFLPQST